MPGFTNSHSPSLIPKTTLNLAPSCVWANECLGICVSYVSASAGYLLRGEKDLGWKGLEFGLGLGARGWVWELEVGFGGLWICVLARGVWIDVGCV
eukprot:1315466-Amorphochlora_amoeboformis.AAC.1